MYKNYENEVKNILQDKKKVISNTDLDGLLSLAIVQEYFPETEFGGWYNNSNIYLAGNGKIEDYVGVDISFTKQFGVDSISNHVEVDATGISCNSHINTFNYYDKSLFSTTLLLLASLDKEKINNMTDKQILLLMTVDSTYMGWYSYDGRFKNKIKSYLEAYELYRVIEVLKQYSLSDLENVKNKCQVWQSVKIKNNFVDIDKFLKTSGFIDIFKILEIPAPKTHNNFTKKVVGEWNRGSVKQYKKLSCENVFIISNAMTYRDVVYYTIFKRVEHIERGLNIA